jgi:hypothetical protein
MITMQNYLLEEEISDASMDDIALEQAIAEFEVATALLECQLKCQMIMENTTTSLDDFDVFMENGFTDAVKGGGKAIGNFFKGVGKSFGDAGKGVGQAVGSGAKGAAQDVASGAKNVANSVVDGGKSIGNAGANLGKDIADNAKTGANWFKTTWNTIITAIGNFFNSIFKVDFEKLIKKVEENYDDDHVFVLRIRNKLFLDYTSKMDKLTKDLLNIRQNYPYDKIRVRSLVDELNKFTEEQSKLDEKYKGYRYAHGTADEDNNLTKAELVKLLKDLNAEAKRSYKTYGQLKKALDLKNLDKDVDKDLVKMYKDLARVITKNWSMAAKEAKKVINTAMGNATKKESSDDDEGFTGTITGESATISMQESTDFDDIDAMTFQEGALQDRYDKEHEELNKWSNVKIEKGNHPSLDKLNDELTVGSDRVDSYSHKKYADNPREFGVAAKWKRTLTRSMAALRSGKPFKREDIDAFGCNLRAVIIEAIADSCEDSDNAAAQALANKCYNFDKEVMGGLDKYVFDGHKDDKLVKKMKAYLQRADKLVKEYMALKTKVKLESYFEDTDALIYEEQTTESEDFNIDFDNI